MITWIQQTFQQHFRTVFAVLLGLTIISFVVTIGPGSGWGRADRQIRSKPFFGANLASSEGQAKVFGDARLSVYLSTGYMLSDDPRLEQYAYTRYASIALADQLHIPLTTDTEIADHIKKMPRFMGANGQFDGKKYSDFRDSLRRGSGVTEADISRVISDDVRADKVQKLLAGPGYVLPAEVKRELAASDTSWTIGTASIDLASFNPTITPTDADLNKYFADNAARYQIPEKIVASYIDFPATAYLNQVNVTEPEIRAYYDANPARFPKPGNPADKTPAPANPAADYPLVRPQVEAALRLERAHRLAAKDASDFAVSLYERKLKFGAPELGSIVAQRHLTLKDLPPFSENEPPAMFANEPQVMEEVSRLNKDHFFTDALSTESGAVILVWKDSIASRQPTLDEVKAKVTADYVAQQKRQRFVDAGRAFHDALAARLKTGEAFDKVVESVASAQGLKAEAKVFPAFTPRQRPQDLDVAALNALQHLEKGEVSDMTVSASNKGVLVYAIDKKAPEINDSNPQYKTTREQIAQYTGARNAAEYLSQIVESELAKTEPAAR